MEFKHDHSFGMFNNTPDRGFNIDICNAYGPWIATIDRPEDVKMFLAAPTMRDYMIERAKNLHSFLYSGVLSEKNAKRVYKDEAEELSRILKILKEAGVEVVE